ncbi:MAG: type II and III secretion system protein family protein [Limnobacter sp.]|uniref:type II and III secretion system protein family protein n=1 Tax=Limnobacter sp. TaxID=2003368 RepID=UPI00391B20D0
MKKTIQIRKLTVAAAIGLMLAAPVQWGSSAQAQNRTITLANISASTPAKNSSAIQPVERARTPTPQAQPMSPNTTDRGPEAPFVLTLSTGFQKVVTLPAVPARVSIGDPAIASVTVLNPTDKGRKSAGVLVTGLKTGSTSLLIWDKGATAARVINVSVTGKAAETISAIKDLKLDTQGQVLTLSGSTPDVRSYQQGRESLTRATQGQAPAELIDQATLQTSGTVQVDVKVVEFTRSELQRLGLNLSGNFRGGEFIYQIANPLTSNSVANAFGLSLSNRAGDLTASLNILQADGYAKVLAEPSLIAQSGQEASFLAGGEIPIPVPSGNGTIGIQYKNFGIGLTFRPTILSNKTIALSVSPEVSDLDFSRGTSIQGILVPAILTRRANTTVELGENQSFVIGGLISRNIIANASRLPWLSELPILGAFFKGNTYSREDKELLIIVTPRFVKPRAADAPKLPLPGQNVGMRPRSVWSQLFLPSGSEPVPGFSTN